MRAKPEIVRCADCGWKGRRQFQPGAYIPKPCPVCGSRNVYPTTTGFRAA